jgi:hypothetical protein
METTLGKLEKKEKKKVRDRETAGREGRERG